MSAWRMLSALALLAAIAPAACHSYHVETTVENRTGAKIEEIEVDYPSASFGKDSLNDGEDYRYRIQINGSGQLKVQYTQAGQQKQIGGPALAEGQEGRLTIVLLPGGKAEFHPELTAAR